MKVGTDGVLLGAWAPSNGEYILDIGTGTGLIALILAQRNPDAIIDAIDIDQSAVEQATENFKASLWSDRLNANIADIKEYSSPKNYDLIISNPPFFINSTPAPNDRRHLARHTDKMNKGDLLLAVKNLLSDTGKFCVILPYHEALLLIELAQQYFLYPEHITTFYSRKNKPAERILISFSKIQTPSVSDHLIQYADGNTWSNDYKSLTKDFYTVL